jgi:hypothetical protein
MYGDGLYKIDDIVALLGRIAPGRISAESKSEPL